MKKSIPNRSIINIGQGQVLVEPPKTGVTWESILKFGGPLFAFLAAVIGLIEKSPSWLLRILTGIAAIFLIAFIVSIIRTLWKKLSRKASEERFILQEQDKLNELLMAFYPFVTEHDSRSIFSIVQNAVGNDGDKLLRVVGPNYVFTWIEFVARRTYLPENNADLFMAQCEEFTAIIQQFNRGCVLRSQKEFESGAYALSDHSINALDGFREEFGAYLRLVEQWSNALAMKWNKLKHGGQSHGTQLVSSFERVKPFKQVAAKV
jgi:hypothetical protein